MVLLCFVGPHVSFFSCVPNVRKLPLVAIHPSLSSFQMLGVQFRSVPWVKTMVKSLPAGVLKTWLAWKSPNSMEV
jgi:hypothetical protein